MAYLIVKWIHIVTSTILFGTGVGTAFFMFMANRSKDVAVIAFTTRMVVIADWLFTTPAVILQPITGMLLARLAGYSMSTGWIVAAIALYLFAGCCWVPVVFMQLRMRDMAQVALANGEPLPEAYWDMNRWWVVLGSAAFPAVVVIFYLMVFAPG